MLTEFLVACTGPTKAPTRKQANTTPAVKDAAIAIHEIAPTQAVNQIFKKGAANPNCVAVTDDYIFAAQADKAIVNVYNRERGSQECIVPFQERLTALTAACDGAVVVMGSEGGRLMLWELCTGRLISTSPTHVQPVTCIAVSADSNFVMSGAEDSTLHVWSVSSLLAFGGKSEDKFPVHTLNKHRASITALAMGITTGPNAIAVSASADGTAIVWKYSHGQPLRTVLLGDHPTSLAIDPVDRGMYVGFQDGSVQPVDFYDTAVDRGENRVNSLYGSGSVMAPLQPPASSRWRPQSPETSPTGSTLSIALSWDSGRLWSGHENGQVVAWDVGHGQWQTIIVTMPGPVTNLCATPTRGWPRSVKGSENDFMRIERVVKPRFDVQMQEMSTNNGIPGDYTFTSKLLFNLGDRGHDRTALSQCSAFHDAFACLTGFPIDMLEESVADLAAWNELSQGSSPADLRAASTVLDANLDDGFMSLDTANGAQSGVSSKDVNKFQLSLQEQNEVLKRKLAALQRIQRVTFQQLDDLTAARDEYLGRPTTAGGRAMRLSTGTLATTAGVDVNHSARKDPLTATAANDFEVGDDQTGHRDGDQSKSNRSSEGNESDEGNDTSDMG